MRTSNPGAADIEDLKIDRATATRSATGSPRWSIASARRSVGESGLSSFGAVVGATEPEHITRLRAAMPHAVFLIPGVGAQGGKVEDLAAAFTAGRASALITVSRALVNAWERRRRDPSSQRAKRPRELRESIWSVSA